MLRPSLDRKPILQKQKFIASVPYMQMDSTYCKVQQARRGKSNLLCQFAFGYKDTCLQNGV